jgi:hypothetical protein
MIGLGILKRFYDEKTNIRMGYIYVKLLRNQKYKSLIINYYSARE